jgi:hypothetical protein
MLTQCPIPGCKDVIDYTWYMFGEHTAKKHFPEKDLLQHRCYTCGERFLFIESLADHNLRIHKEKVTHNVSFIGVLPTLENCDKTIFFL